LQKPGDSQAKQALLYTKAQMCRHQTENFYQPELISWHLKD